MTKRWKGIVVLALALSVGGHWALLQCLAWTTMAVRYSQSLPLAKALEYTFDGEHPCALCVAVKQGKEKERTEPVLKPLEKLVLFLETGETLSLAVLTPRPATVFQSNYSPPFQETPHQPPRIPASPTGAVLS